jgi:hypothetical protein
VYPYFRSRETRLSSIESLFIHFLFRGKTTSAVWENGEVRYTNAGMLQYKERLENSCANLRAELVPRPGKGERIVIKNFPRVEAPLTLFAAGQARGSWREFLASYKEKLCALPPPRSPVMSYLHGLSKDEKELLTTLLPVSAACFKETQTRKPETQELLDLSRAWTIEMIDRFC